MKIIIVSLISLVAGYFLYPVINPPQKTTNIEIALKDFFEAEARRYAEADSAEKKLKAADELYAKMMLIFLSQLSLKGPENKPVRYEASNAAPGPVVYVQSSVPVSENKTKKNLTLPDRIMNNHLFAKDVILFSSFPVIDASDSRIKKLIGLSLGKLKPLGPSRTGMEETIKLLVSGTTKIEAQDTYDNVTISYLTDTNQAFKGVPGDENLLMMTLPDYFVFIDLRGYPTLVGKIYREHRQTGEFQMQKKI